MYIYIYVYAKRKTGWNTERDRKGNNQEFTPGTHQVGRQSAIAIRSQELVWNCKWPKRLKKALS